jgi:uncharacterized protein YbjQ (UPF0145 family)
MDKFYNSLEQSINEVKEDAFQKLQQNAINLKANAVVGIHLDIETFPNTTAIIVSVTGTAVSVA